MLSKLFGFKKSEEKKATVDIKNAFSFLQADMHSHLLPGIDDGAQTVEDSLAMIKPLLEMGYKKLIVTPHIKSDIYPNSPTSIHLALKELQQALQKENIQIPIHAAAEYYIDDRFMDMLQKKELLTVYNNEVLVEFSFVFEPIGLTDTIFKIQTSGYNPIFAHPERYSFYLNKREVFKEIKDRGALLQLNTLSLSGYYGKPVKELAEWLLEKGYYDYCGTDMHHDKHLKALSSFIQSKNYHVLTQYPFLNKKLV